ncbi:hypothetical protein [Clostridium algidicarnis]|uniref:YD repeat-containing protein n=1 Tax=Clostridium algidicarnis TaxID=37659 RepID=A0ABS6C6A7_9CLOT|nr:hypothetical protein [Clostridium algidicarnis]MBU3195020.1 hypothetical protein [Clostridium algidicarnis]MBU3221022.1 hypothetical protein [Clostridium algidicarnis]
MFISNQLIDSIEYVFDSSGKLLSKPIKPEDKEDKLSLIRQIRLTGLAKVAKI